MTQRLAANIVRPLLTELREFVHEYMNMVLDHFDEWLEVEYVYAGMILPDGWKFLGAGISRHAFLGPDGWVYKIGNSESNRRETDHSHLLYPHSDATLAFPYVEPVTDDYKIIRCEYIDGEFLSSDFGVPAEPGEREAWSGMNEHIGRITRRYLGYTMFDIHTGNVCFVDGTPVFIDLG